MTLLRHWNLTPSLKFSLHLTSCIVREPPPGLREEKTVRCLLVPTNPTLTSTTLFPYFRRGGSPVRRPRPQPTSRSSSRWGGMDAAVTSSRWGMMEAATTSSRWGGMDAGSDMLYPVQTVDGQVYIEGGKEYWDELEAMRSQVGSGKGVKLGEDDHGSEGVKDDNGDLPDSLTCKAVGNLASVGYDKIIHVASPAYEGQNCEGSLLRKCYMRGFVAAGLTDHTDSEGLGRTLVTPLVGAGCRGWPVGLAARSAVEAIQDLASISSAGNDKTKRIVRLAVIDQEVARKIMEVAMDRLESDR